MKTTLPRFTTTPDKGLYTTHMGQKVRLGQRVVTVVSYTREGRSGSYERGFKFSSTKYGGLLDSKGHYSFDHGKTWHASFGYAHGAWKATPRGDRIRIDSETRKEFAFDGIQKINRDYDPSYKWKP